MQMETASLEERNTRPPPFLAVNRPMILAGANLPKVSPTTDHRNDKWKR